MSTQLVEDERIESVARKITGPQAPQADVHSYESLETGHPSGVARGIVSAILIATPFWMLFGLALYLLI